MKKILATGLSLLCAGVVFAGGIENKTNMSTGYLRNPSRNTENKRPEAAFYNIAGTAFMDDGLYIEAGNQFIVKEYKNELDEPVKHPLLGTLLPSGDYNDETFVYLYPDFDAVYKHENWAAFMNFGIYAGGGKLEYSEGTSATALAFLRKAMDYIASNTTISGALQNAAKDHSLTVTSITYGGQLGGAYAINDMISLAAAFRMTYGTQDLKLKSDYIALLNDGDEISYNANALGFTGVFGVHARPVEKLDVAAQFSLASQMKYKLHDIKGTLARELLPDDEFRTDLAPVLNLGAGYQVLDPLYVSASFNYYFNTAAKMNSVLSETKYNNSFEVALGADYDINEKITASAGVAYGKQGTKDDANSTFNPVLDSFQIGGGVEVRPITDLTITGGATWVKYFDADYYVGSYKTVLSKPQLIMFSLGATYRFGL